VGEKGREARGEGGKEELGFGVEEKKDTHPLPYNLTTIFPRGLRKDKKKKKNIRRNKGVIC